jgi:hypothetical protein
MGFIETRKPTFGIEPICRALGVPTSTYDARRSRTPSARAVRDAELVEQIDHARRGYGSRPAASSAGPSRWCDHGHRRSRPAASLLAIVVTLTAAAGHVPPQPTLALAAVLVVAGIAVAGMTHSLPYWTVALLLASAGIGVGNTASVGILLDAVGIDRIVTAMVVWSQIGILGISPVHLSAALWPNSSTTPTSPSRHSLPPACSSRHCFRPITNPQLQVKICTFEAQIRPRRPRTA